MLRTSLRRRKKLPHGRLATSSTSRRTAGITTTVKLRRCAVSSQQPDTLLSLLQEARRDWITDDLKALTDCDRRAFGARIDKLLASMQRYAVIVTSKEAKATGGHVVTKENTKFWATYDVREHGTGPLLSIRRCTAMRFRLTSRRSNLQHRRRSSRSIGRGIRGGASQRRGRSCRLLRLVAVST